MRKSAMFYSTMIVLEKIAGLAPYLFVINIVLVLYLVIKNRRAFSNTFRPVNRMTWMLLLLIVLFSVFLRISLPVYHRMWMDEHLYISAAKEILQDFAAPYYRLVGWPMLLSFVFSVTGVSGLTAIHTGMLLATLTLPLFFWFVYAATRNEHVSLLSVLVVSLFPSFIVWGSSAETNICSMFFSLLALLFSMLYYKSPKASLLWLAVTGISLSIFFRPENILLGFIFLAGVLIFVKNYKKKLIKSWQAIAVLGILVLPNLCRILEFYVLTGGTENLDALLKQMSLDIFIMYPHYVLNNWILPVSGGAVLVVVLALGSVAGFAHLFFRDRALWKFLLFWFFVSYIFVSAASPGQLERGALSRFGLMLVPTVSVIFSSGMCFAAAYLKKQFRLFFIALLIMFLILTASSYVQYLGGLKEKTHDSQRILMTQIPGLARDGFSDDCVILALHSEIFSETEFTIVEFGEILENRTNISRLADEKCVLFFEGYCCLYRNMHMSDLGRNSFDVCRQAKGTLNLSVKKKFSYQNAYYTFYSVTLPEYQ